MKNKNIVAIVIAVMISIGLIFYCCSIIGTGLRKRNDVILYDYSVSSDGRKLTFSTSIESSAGYIRGFKDCGGGVRPHYLDFYSTFGGLNSSFGEKHTFELNLDETDTEIYFNRADGGYELVLYKSEETGEWVRP